MCEARVVMREGAGETEVMEDVSSITPEDGGLRIANILGESVKVDAKIVEVQMLHPHTVVLEANQ